MFGAMRAAGLVVTAGTEHNTLDLLPIEPACLKAAPVPDEVKEIFWEGACVVAAHQFLTLHRRVWALWMGRANPTRNTATPTAASRLSARSAKRSFSAI